MVAKQVISEGRPDRGRVLSTVVTSGTGGNAATDEFSWGKTGTTDDNGDAWFCGATEEITACVWVGHPDSVEPMLTEFAGAPVDGGTFPALIFADLVNAYQALEAEREAGEDPEPSEEPVTEAPPTEAVPTESAADRAPAADPEPAAPDEAAGGGGDTSAAAPEAPSAPDPAPAAPTDGGGIIPE